MEAAARDFVDFLIPIVELIGGAVIGVGVIVAFAAYVLSELRIRPRPYEGIRLLLGRFLALGLEFQLASDILGTAVSPSFAEIGKLGAIAAIRTLLNYFLAQDIERAQRIVERDRQLGVHPLDGPGSPGAATGSPDAGAKAASDVRG
jgi:uncharacterized membrane protein